MENQERKHEADNFFSWVRHEKFAIGLAVFCALFPILSEFKWEKLLVTSESIEPDSFLYYVQHIIKNQHQYQIVNILFIFIILFMLTRMKILLSKDHEKVEKLHEYVKNKFGENSTLARNTPEVLFNRINTAIEQFYFSWVSVWTVWLIMYIVKFIFTMYSFQQLDLTSQMLFRVDNLLENSLNLIGSFILFFIYMDITVSTVRVGTLTDNGRNTMHVGVFTLILIGTIFFTIDLFSLFLEMSNYHYTQFFLRLCIGIIASMSMMSVLGRLNTSYLRIPQSLIMCLYLYATIQMLYPLTYRGEPFLPSTELLNDVLGILAFLGKGCLILVLQWITKENRFLFFLIHKANSLSDSNAMLRQFNKYYKGCPDK